MAEESYYSSDNKRKYEDSDIPASRRPTGFSAPISLQSSTGGSSGGQQPASYNNAPPPLDDIELAKQKAQEIAARIFNNAEAAAKKPRVENGGGGGGLDSNEGFYQKTFTSSVPPAASSYGFPGSSKKIEVPNGRVGLIIGKGGETIKYLQMQSGAKIQITRDMDADPYSATRSVELVGTPEQVSKAEQLIEDVLAEANTGGPGPASRGVTGDQSGPDSFVMKVPNNKVGLVIGKGGETIKSMQASTGARIQVIPLHLPPGDTSTERTVQINGTSEQIEAAKQLVNEVTAENRMRNQTMSGSYSQQGYQSRPPSNWAPPGTASAQQPGYGYIQPGGTYPPPPQYNMPQPPYPGYPPQPTSAPSNQQPVQGGGGYDYYSQQQPPHQQQAAGGDNSSYAYNQQLASGYNQGQGYYGYGGYGQQSGYGQTQPNPVSEYDQQQNYNSTNPPPDGQPSPKPSYGVPPTSQGGYGTQPPGGYNQGYSESTQPGYAPPSESAAPAQSGYGGGPSYGAPPNYGQAQESPYSVNYTGGYSQAQAQAQAYSGDGNHGGNGSREAAVVQPNAATKPPLQS